MEDYDYKGKEVNQLLTSIKASVEAGDSRDYIEGYVKDIPADALSKEQIKDLNNAINPKGYNIANATPGYALEDYVKWPILNARDENNIVYQDGKLFQYNWSWFREVYDNWDSSSGRLSRRITMPGAANFDSNKEYQVMSYSDAEKLAQNPWVQKTEATISLWREINNYLYIADNLVDKKKYPTQNTANNKV